MNVLLTLEVSNNDKLTPAWSGGLVEWVTLCTSDLQQTQKDKRQNDVKTCTSLLIWSLEQKTESAVRSKTRKLPTPLDEPQASSQY